MLASTGCRRLAIALIVCLSAVAPAGAVEVAQTHAFFEWTPATGPVDFYYVYVSRNGAPRQLELLRLDNLARVDGEVGETIQVWVRALTNSGALSDFSEPSEPILFVAAASPPPETPPR